ncbi:MAG TPA: hypothetical protein VK864_08120, partial [Longimicrobiales bacterium]|nr:hypothetical protein [Longimicrobiales bacterium]
MKSQEQTRPGSMQSDEGRALPSETKQLLERIAPLAASALRGSSAALALFRGHRDGVWSAWYGEQGVDDRRQLLNELTSHTGQDNGSGFVAMPDVRQ